MNNFQWIPDCVQNSLVDLVKKVHSDFDVPLEVHKIQNNRVCYSIAQASPIRSEIFMSLQNPEYATCDIEKLDIPISQLRLSIPEHTLMSTRYSVVSEVKEALTSFTNLKDLSIQFISTDESILAIGDTVVTQSPVRSEFIVTVRAGLGISYKLKEKIHDHCKKNCDKFIRCILQPEKCNLSFIMKSIGASKP